MGPCHRFQTERTRHITVQNLPHDSGGGQIVAQIPTRARGKGIHLPIHLTLCITLLYTEKGRQTMTSTGLQANQLHHN
jgi:hypothetical protein